MRIALVLACVFLVACARPPDIREASAAVGDEATLDPSATPEGEPTCAWRPAWVAAASVKKVPVVTCSWSAHK